MAGRWDFHVISSGDSSVVSDGSPALSGVDLLPVPGLVLGEHDAGVVLKARLVPRLKERAVEKAPYRPNMRGMEWRSDWNQSTYSAM